MAIGVLSQEPDDDFEDIIDASKVQLGEMLTMINKKFYYIYDFGDYWQHQITIEDILPYDPTQQYPVCIKGKSDCPPEDCGGVDGFYHMLEVMKNPKHPEYKDIMEWMGEEYQANYFDKDAINEALSALS